MSTAAATDPITDDAVAIGSYSLETLTTGMYENPLHCIREYVQNAFDAIRQARTDGVLADGGGLVTISVGGTAKRPSLNVRDDGAGIPAAQAITTLVSIGASRKRANVNAGFRGIGRLAGVAYCSTLRFTTSAPGESEATVVEFDCGRMRGFMRPGAEWKDVREVLRLCVKTGSATAKPNDHFMEVEMVGLTGIGLEFAEIERLVPYLRQVCPADYSDRFAQAPRIRSFAESLNHRIGAVEVETRYKRERTQILKAYDDSSPTSDPRRPSVIRDVELISSPELGWFGWIGLSNFKGELTDSTVAGVRFRMKNIQIGGSEIIEELGAELTLGGTEGRLQRWAIGEIFVTSAAVVPNARRDGFEDGPAWREIRKDVKKRVARRVVTLVREASNSRKTLKAITAETKVLADILARGSVDAATAEKVATAIARLLARLRPDKLSGGDPNELGELASRLKALRDRLTELRGKEGRPPGTDGGTGGDANGAEAEAAAAGGEDGSPESDEEDDTDTGGDGHEDGDNWTTEQLLQALRTVLVQELGEAEAERLDRLARELLGSGG